MKDNNIIGLLFRVSSEQQVRKGEGLKNQKDIGRKLCKNLGFDIEEFDEGVQSSYDVELEEREVLFNLIKRIEDKKNPIRKVWIYNTDRLGRSSSAYYKTIETFYKYEVKIYQGISTTPIDLSNFTEKLLINILGAISSYDNELRRMRSNQGKRNSLLRGNTYVGGTIPFGFSVDNKKLVLNEEEKIVKDIFSKYSKGISTKEIKKWLDSNSNIKPRRSNTWSLGTIIKMLKNELYNGVQTWRWKKILPNKEIKYIGEPIKVKVPKIIDDNTFKIVQRRITEITTLRIRSRKERDETLLGGLLKCDKCKLQLSHRFREEQGYGNHYFGRCTEHQWKTNEKKIPKSECSIQRSLRIEETDELVLNNLIDLLKKSANHREKYRVELLNQKEKDKEISKEKSKKIRKRIKNLSNTIESLEDIIASTIVKMGTKETSKSLGKKIIKESDKDINKRKDELDDLVRELSILKDGSKFVDWIDIMGKDISKIKSKPKVTQRNWIRSFVRNILVEYDTVTQSHKLKINFFIGLVDDSWKRIGRDTKGILEYEITDGEKSLELNYKWIKKTENINKDYLENVVNHISILKTDGHSNVEICNKLNQLNIKTIRGKRWNKDILIKFRNKYVTKEIIPK